MCRLSGRCIALTLVIFTWCVLPGTVRAEVQDLMFYYKAALANDPTLRSAQFENQANKESLQQAYAGLLPQVNAFLSYNKNYQDVISSENTVYEEGTADYETESYGAALTQPIFRYSSFLAVSQSKSVLKQADSELEKARQDLMLRVVEAYVEVLAMQEKLAEVMAEEAALTSHYERARERTDRGLAPIMDRYDSEARLAVVTAQRGEVEFALNDAKEALTEICAVPVGEIKVLQEEIPLEPPLPDNAANWVDAAVEGNLDVSIQKYKSEVSEVETRRQQAAHYPTVDLVADYAWQDATDSFYGGGSNTAVYNVGVKLLLPLYEGGLTVSKTREAASLEAADREGVVKVTREAERKARSLQNSVLSAINRFMAMKKSVEAQQLVLSAKEEGVRSGMMIGLAILDATQDLYKYKREYSQARHDFILGTMRLRHVAGMLGEGDIARVNELLR